MANILSKLFKPEDEVQVPMRVPDPAAAGYTTRAMEALQRINGTTNTALSDLDMTLPKTGNSALDAKNVLDARTAQLEGKGGMTIVQAVNQPATPTGAAADQNLLARARTLGVDTSRSVDQNKSANVFTTPGAVITDSSGNTMNYAPPAARSAAAPVETYDVKNKDGTVSTYRKPTPSPATEAPAIVVAGRPSYQLGDLDRSMNAQTVSQWGPEGLLSMPERLAAEKHGKLAAKNIAAAEHAKNTLAIASESTRGLG
jgi:hypothetical protein